MGYVPMGVWPTHRVGSDSGVDDPRECRTGLLTPLRKLAVQRRSDPVVKNIRIPRPSSLRQDQWETWLNFSLDFGVRICDNAV